MIDCHFNTERLHVSAEISPANQALAERIIEILTPEVTKALPDGWQQIDSIEKACAWLDDRRNESTVLLINENDTTLGFIFLYEGDMTNGKSNLRFGYLLAEDSWGKGIGTEVLTGFVDWCTKNGTIASISGGVEKSNIGSIKVLEKVGFVQSDETPETIFYTYNYD